MNPLKPILTYRLSGRVQDRLKFKARTDSFSRKITALTLSTYLVSRQVKHHHLRTQSLTCLWDGSRKVCIKKKEGGREENINGGHHWAGSVLELHMYHIVLGLAPCVPLRWAWMHVNIILLECIKHCITSNSSRKYCVMKIWHGIWMHETLNLHIGWANHCVWL
jgi:hypothetical protein